MHYGVKKGRKRAGNLNRPKMQLVRFDHLAQNGVEIKFLNTLTCSGECLGVVGVVRSAFWGPLPLGDCPLLGHTGSPSAKRGVWGDPPPIIGCTWLPCVKRGVWGDPPPILGTKLAIPWCQEGGLGGSSPHYRDKIGPPGVKRGSGGILSPF